MRILAFGDVHDEESYYEDIVHKIEEFRPSLVIGVGDIVNYKKLLDNISKGRTKFDFVFVHGNNDSLEDIQARVKKQRLIHYLNNDVKKIGNIKFFGIGGVVGVKSRNFSLKTLKSQLEKTDEVDILITHLDPDSRGGDLIKEFVRDKKPKYWIHGHEHEGAGRIYRIGGTILINASKPVVMDLEL